MKNGGEVLDRQGKINFLALNPNATIPMLIDDDLVLWQSNSIIRYLANQYAGQALYPVDAKQRAAIDQ